MKLNDRWILAVLFLTLCISSVAVAAKSRDSMIDAQISSPAHEAALPDATDQDQKAKVYEVTGKALLTKKGSPTEREIKAGDMIEIGDAVYTEKGASISIAFDHKKKNAVRIPADTKATFTSIEPTDIKLDQGSIFSAVTGLAAGSTWKVTTPAAVAAVRGTVYLVRYETSSGQFFAATLDVPDDGKTSAIEIQSLTSEGNAIVIEGKEITLKEGESPTQEMVQDLSPEVIAELQAFFEQVSSEQQAAEVETSSGEEQKEDSSTTEEKSGDMPLDEGPGDEDPGLSPDDNGPPTLEPDDTFLKDEDLTEKEPDDTKCVNGYNNGTPC